MKGISLDSRYDFVRSQVHIINMHLEQSINKSVSVIVEITETSVVLTRYLNTFVDLQLRVPIDESNGFFVYDGVLRVLRLYVQMFHDLLTNKYGKDI